MTDPTPLQACAALALLYVPTCGRNLESEEDREALVGAVTILAGGDRHGAAQALDEAQGILHAQIEEIEDPADLFSGLGQVLLASDASLPGEVFSTLVTSLGPPDSSADHAIATFGLVANALGQTEAAAEVLMSQLQHGEQGDSESKLDYEVSKSRAAAADVRDGAPRSSAPKVPAAQTAAPRSNEALVQTLRQSSLTFTEMGLVAATRLEFGESGRQQVVCVVTDPQVAAFAEYGRVGVYSVIGCDTESDDLHRVMAAVETAAPLGGFRLSEGQLVFHAEVPAEPAVEELERVVVTCGRIADACESMLTGDEDAF